MRVATSRLLAVLSHVLEEDASVAPPSFRGVLEQLQRKPHRAGIGVSSHGWFRTGHDREQYHEPMNHDVLTVRCDRIRNLSQPLARMRTEWSRRQLHLSSSTRRDATHSARRSCLGSRVRGPITERWVVHGASFHSYQIPGGVIRWQASGLVIVVHPDCAGIDIGKRKYDVAVDPERFEAPVRHFAMLKKARHRARHLVSTNTSRVLKPCAPAPHGDCDRVLRGAAHAVNSFAATTLSLPLGQHTSAARGFRVPAIRVCYTVDEVLVPQALAGRALDE